MVPFSVAPEQARILNKDWPASDSDHIRLPSINILRGDLGSGQGSHSEAVSSDHFVYSKMSFLPDIITYILGGEKQEAF